jgi:kynureninase
VRRVADVVGSLIGAPPGTTVMRQNVADLLGDVVSALDWRGPRNRVVTSDLEWPGSLHTWSQIARWGGEAVVVPAQGIELDLDAMVAAIDERTLLVECSHVLFRTSTLNDVRPLVERAHEVGALAVVDGYQAAGTVPVDVVDLGVDVYLGGSVKYLSGGPGNGWMYVRPGLDLEPVTTGWFGQRAPFDFDRDNHYAEGVARFTGGTPGVPAHYGAGPAYEALAEIGVQRVRERSQSMTQPLLEAALELGFTVRSPHDPARRGGHVTIDPGDSERVHDALHAQGFVVDHRPGVGIRVSPHFYNTMDEAMGCLAAMRAAR